MLTGCNNQDLSDDEVQEEDIYFELEPIKTIGCTNQIREYYQSQDRKVYFVCLEEIYVKISGSKDITLKDNFDSVKQSFDDSIDELVEQMDLVNVYYDGGTKLYSKDNYRILECKTLDGNKDVYFGDETLEYQVDYCVNK